MQIAQSEPLLLTCHDFKDLLLEAMSFHLAIANHSSLGRGGTVQTTERVPKTLRKYIFIMDDGKFEVCLHFVIFD